MDPNEIVYNVCGKQEFPKLCEIHQIFEIAEMGRGYETIKSEDTPRSRTTIDQANTPDHYEKALELDFVSCS